MRMREFGSAARLPLARPKSTAPMLAAIPMRGCDRGLDQVHGVVYGQPGVQRTTGGVDVHLNLVVGVALGQVQ
jgi:hypothetical protein